MSPLHAILVLAVLLFAAWMYFERRQHRTLRIILGSSCVAIIALGWALSSIRTAMIESHEWAHLNASMERLERILEQGDVARAKAAIGAYNSTLDSTDDPYAASMMLWQSFPE